MTEQDPRAALAKMIDLATPFAVRTAVALQLPELIAGGTDELDSLAEATGACRDALRRLLRHLVAVGLFEEPSPGRYHNTAVAVELLGDDETKRWYRNWLNLEGPGGRIDLAFAGMPHSIRTGQPGYAAVHGQPFWDDIAARPELSEFFNGVMAAHTWQTAPTLAKEYNWARVSTLVDVGGGIGEVTTALLQTHPHLRGTVVDLPSSIAGARATFTEAGIADRAEAIAGSFFEPLPGGADLYLVSRVLTDWSDEEARTILTRCAEAAAPNGRVLITEVLPGAEHTKNTSSFDLQMLVLVGGRERTMADFAALAAQAGLTVTWSRTWEDGLMLMECTVADTVAGE